MERQCTLLKQLQQSADGKVMHAIQTVTIVCWWTGNARYLNSYNKVLMDR